MSARFAAMLLAVLVIGGCGAERPVPEEARPEWLTTLIRELESQPAANPPAFIARYDYEGQTVYYLPPRCCDIRSNLYDAKGAIVCHPDGGITGGGDGRCPDFFAVRTDEKILWQDTRDGG